MQSLEMEDEVNKRFFLQFRCVDESSYDFRKTLRFIDKEKNPILHKYISMIANKYL